MALFVIPCLVESYFTEEGLCIFGAERRLALECALEYTDIII